MICQVVNYLLLRLPKMGRQTSKRQDLMWNGFQWVMPITALFPLGLMNMTTLPGMIFEAMAIHTLLMKKFINGQKVISTPT